MKVFRMVVTDISRALGGCNVTGEDERNRDQRRLIHLTEKEVQGLAVGDTLEVSIERTNRIPAWDG